MMLKCLSCGSRIADKAFIQLLEEQNPLVSSEEIEVELDREYPNFECHACDFPYNKLVPEEEWDEFRRQVLENLVEFQKAQAKAYDRLSRTLQSDDFKQKAERCRLVARYNRQVIPDKDDLQR